MMSLLDPENVQISLENFPSRQCFRAVAGFPTLKINELPSCTLRKGNISIFWSPNILFQATRVSPMCVQLFRINFQVVDAQPHRGCNRRSSKCISAAKINRGLQACRYQILLSVTTRHGRRQTIFILQSVVSEGYNGFIFLTRIIN